MSSSQSDELHHFFRGVAKNHQPDIYGPVSGVPTPPHGMGGGYDAPVVVYIHTYIPTYLPTYLPTYIPTYIHAYIPLHYLTLHYLTLPYITLPYIPYIHTYIHTYITYIHTYIHRYIDT